MDVQMELKGISEVLARYRARIDRASDLTVPLTRAGAVTVSASKMKFRQNDWAPNTPDTAAAKGSSQPGMDSGRLFQSIAASDPTPTEIRIGTNLRYARWFQEGTGEYAGHGSWEIRASGKGALRFMTAEGVRFRKKVIMRGQPSRVFLEFTDALRAQILAIFRAYILSGEAISGGGA